MRELALASTAADAEAAESIEQDTAALAGALDARVSAVLEAARSDADVDERRADLFRWCEEQLLTQLKAEESALYPAGASIPEARPVVEAMRAEHDVIARLVGELRAATTPVVAVAASAELRGVVEAHLAKETSQLVPALAVAPEVALSDLLGGMRDIQGVAATRSEPDRASHDHADGGCGCGESDGPGFPELDVRVVPHAIRHATVFGALDAVRPGRGMVLIAPHDPLPLLAQIEQRQPGAFEISYLQRGPEAWHLQFVRA